MHRVLRLEEVAEFLRVHPTTIYRLLHKDKIPAFKVGSEWRFNRESVESWVMDLEARRRPRSIVVANGRR
jgi:excisionase family DNA binding protein